MGNRALKKSNFTLYVEDLQHRFGFVRTYDGPYWIYNKMTFVAISVKHALGLI